MSMISKWMFGSSSRFLYHVNVDSAVEFSSLSFEGLLVVVPSRFKIFCDTYVKMSVGVLSCGFVYGSSIPFPWWPNFLFSFSTFCFVYYSFYVGCATV